MTRIPALLSVVPFSLALLLGEAPAPAPFTAPLAQVEQHHANDQIAVNLGFINTALQEYADQNHDTLPDHLGQLVRLVPSINVFFEPDTKLPDEVRDGTPDQQAPWINMHTIFAFPAAGTRAGTTPASGMLVYERPDLHPLKPRLAVLYGDGHVDTAQRDALDHVLALH